MKTAVSALMVVVLATLFAWGYTNFVAVLYHENERIPFEDIPPLRIAAQLPFGIESLWAIIANGFIWGFAFAIAVVWGFRYIARDIAQRDGRR